MDPANVPERRSDPRRTREVYTHGYGERVVSEMARRSLANSLSFLLPHLRPGTRILDCGCGPGAIAADVAEHIAPGEVIGVDIEPSQIDAARRRAAERGLANAHFEVASLYELPFPDTSFDVAYAHTVVQHLREPLRALREVRRVLAPRGLLGLRDDDWGAYLWEPRDPLVELAMELIFKVMRHNGGDAFYPRHQRRLLREAGFARTAGSASAGCRGTADATRTWAEAVIEHNSAPAFVQTVLEQGWADQATLAATHDAMRAWGEHPDAYQAVMMCEAIGWVDEGGPGDA
jgi:ubiquinone/menaquinone biosynthesis C-methylase UbiE